MMNKYIKIEPVEISTPLYTFQMIVPSEVLDDTVIDDFVLTYSKKFIKA